MIPQQEIPMIDFPPAAPTFVPASRPASANPATSRCALTSLVDVFRQQAAERPDRIAFTHVRSGDEIVSEDCTYAQLDRQAKAIATLLRQYCQAGDRVLLMYDAGLEYIAALAGCLYAGVVAVPVFPPDPMRVAHARAAGSNRH